MRAPLISFDDAFDQVINAAPVVGTESVPLSNAAGRVLAAPLHARFAFPRHATAMRDGYAVIAADVAAGQPLRIIGECHAGASVTGQIASGQSMRIFTGAAVPAGADTVIMQEYAEVAGDVVRFRPGHGPGRHIRAAGSDFSEGAVLLDAGVRLSPRAMVTAAAADVAYVTVAVPPRVAIIGSGDELAEPGAAHLSVAAIPDSVTCAIAAMARDAGAEPVSRTIAGDDLPLLERLAAEALTGADIVIVTGGASVGERDYGKAMFAPHGLEVMFAGVAMMPGRPVWFGRAGDRLILGLPGNPSSAMVTARLFLSPLIAAMLGQTDPEPAGWRMMPLARAISSTDERETFLRARWQADGLVPVDNQDSGMQAVLAQSDWLIRRLPGAPAAAAGETVAAISF